MPAPKGPHLLCLAPLPGRLSHALAERFVCHTSLNDGEENSIRGLVGSGNALYREGLLDILPNLEIISVFGTGYEGVPVDYCRSRGIRVTHTPDVLTEDMADVALALVLMTSRRLLEANRFLHDGGWPAMSFPLGFKPGGKRAGIFGLGRVGQAVARRLEALGMRVGYAARRPNLTVSYPFFRSLHDLAFWSDFLIIACPGGSATRHLVDTSVLEMLGPDGTLINITRGSVVDESALVHALETGTIRAAGLDVYEREPLVPDQLTRLPQVVLLPHVGSRTQENREEMARIVHDNLIAHFQGQPLLNVIPDLRTTTQRRLESVTLFSSPPPAVAAK
jgi:hydroxypyruvate reductase